MLSKPDMPKHPSTRMRNELYTYSSITKSLPHIPVIISAIITITIIANAINPIMFFSFQSLLSLKMEKNALIFLPISILIFKHTKIIKIMLLGSMLNDDYVQPEEARRLKKLGYGSYGSLVYFQEEGYNEKHGYRMMVKNDMKPTDFVYTNDEEGKVCMPGLAVADRWIREKYLIFMEINMDEDEKIYCDTIHDCEKHKVIKIPNAPKFEIYEQAWTFGFDFLLDYIEKNR